MASSDVTIFICISCTAEGARVEKPGRALFDAVTAAADGKDGCTVKPVDCLAVCKRPCTIALSGEGKWTYVVGDLSPDTHAGDIVAAAVSYGASSNGIIPWRERPQAFRKGVISRIPPLSFKAEEQALTDRDDSTHRLRLG